MDRIAEKLAGWFGSTPFILIHMLWFGTWITLHMTGGLDEDWSMLTIIVSLEAIFLSLFILRAENVQSGRFEEDVKRDLRTSKEILDEIKSLRKKR